MPSDPYKPIACGDYDIYEIAIMKQRLLRLEWEAAEGGFYKQIVTPLELKIVDSAEYLFYKKLDENLINKIRLDKIKSAVMV